MITMIMSYLMIIIIFNKDQDVHTSKLRKGGVGKRTLTAAVGPTLSSSGATGHTMAAEHLTYS